MPIVTINRTDTMEQLRVKNNIVSSGVGSLSTLTANASLIYTGIIGQNEVNFAGSPAQFTIRKANKTYYIQDINIAGNDYSVGSVIIIPGSQLGGVDTVNDATITVLTVDGNGGILTANITGIAVSDLVSEVNKLREESGTTALTTTSQTISGAINELDLKQGNEVLTTTSQTISGAINEHETDIGIVANLQTTSKVLVNALNEIRTIAIDAQSEIGGNVADLYNGPENTIIAALNNLYSASSVSTLNLEFLRRDGLQAMTGSIKLHSDGIDSQLNNLLLKTNGSTRVTISSSNGNIGIAKAPSTYKLDVSGTINADTLRFSGESTDERYLRTNASIQTVFTPTVFEGTVIFNDPVQIGAVIVGNDSLSIQEWTEDVVGAMFTGNAESGGISAVYDDTLAKIVLSISNNSHSHIASNISDFQESVEDVVGGMVSSNIESGINVTYDDVSGKLNFDVNDPVISVSGEATGSATMVNLGNTTIAITLDQEVIQDKAAPLFTSGGHVGINTSYDDTNNRVTLSLASSPTINLTGDASGSTVITNLANSTFNLPVTIANDSHNHSVLTIDNFIEEVQDVVGAMVSFNTESGLAVTYDDNTGKLNFDVADFTITLSGDITGSATVTNLGNVNISTNLASGSIGAADLANNIINSSKLVSPTALTIYNSGGSALKTIWGSGS